jgi:hypothetical protein
MIKHEHSFIKTPEMSDWTCYLFGATESSGMRWNPEKDKVPNWFTRWMMKVCFGCTWVRKAQEK